MSAGLELLALSIGNVVSYLRLQAGVDGPAAGFRWPVGPPDAFELPFRTDFLTQQMSGGRVLELSDVVARSTTEILASYADDDPEESSRGV